MDADIAIWLGELIGRAVIEMAHSPGLTIEVTEMPDLWLQVIPEESTESAELGGFLLNFPYREPETDPLERLIAAGVSPPPDTRLERWEQGGYATLWIRPDVPLVGLAHFSGDILEHLTGAPPDADLSVRYEYGF
jgi:hypothetical protein